MADSKPLASLTSGLLARKGGARPAMRRQSVNLAEAQSAHFEDLGWNDMGYDVDPETEEPSSEPMKFKPLANAIPDVVRQQARLAQELDIPKTGENEKADEAGTVDATHCEPETVSGNSAAKPRKAMALPPLDASAQAEAVATEDDPGDRPVIAGQDEIKVQDVTHLSRSKSRKRAAFTLRLDRERHLRLRLACAVRGKSAQSLVTDALDQFLNSIPEVDELARRVPNNAAETD